MNRGNHKLKGLCAILLGATVVAGAMGASAAVARSSRSASGPGNVSGDLELRAPDPHKELRQLSKDLKLKKDQRAGVSVILEERAREINLLLEIDSLSHEYREMLATKVMADSDAQIETLLRNKQKIKFDRELARDRETR